MTVRYLCAQARYAFGGATRVLQILRNALYIQKSEYIREELAVILRP